MSRAARPRCSPRSAAKLSRVGSDDLLYCNITYRFAKDVSIAKKWRMIPTPPPRTPATTTQYPSFPRPAQATNAPNNAIIPEAVATFRPIHFLSLESIPSFFSNVIFSSMWFCNITVELTGERWLARALPCMARDRRANPVQRLVMRQPQHRPKSWLVPEPTTLLLSDHRYGN